MSDVSAVTNYFGTVNEGFSATTNGTVLAGASIVAFNSIGSLVNGTIFVGIINPGEASQQTFTGTVDTAGSRITGVKWTRGTNVDHASGATVVDYVTGTFLNMLSTGIRVAHNQDGTLKTGVLLTSPKLSDGIYDTNNKALLSATATASAVNYFGIANGATSGKPTLSALGTDSNIHINLVPKGDAEVQHNGIGPTRNDWTRNMWALYPSSTTAGTWAEGTGSGWYTASYYTNTSQALNDQIDYKVWLEAGTYTFYHVFGTGTAGGQVQIIIAGANSGTALDTYDTTNHHIFRQTTGYAIIAPNSFITISYKMTGKNASSSAYNLKFFFLSIVRTS